MDNFGRPWPVTKDHMLQSARAQMRAACAAEDRNAARESAAIQIEKLYSHLDAIRNASFRTTIRTRWSSLWRRRLTIIAKSATPAGVKERQRIALSLRYRLGLRSNASHHNYWSTEELEFDDAIYLRWVEKFDTVSISDRNHILLHIASSHQPKILVLACFTSATAVFADRFLESLKSQLLDAWRAMFLVTEADSSKTVSELRQRLGHDERVTIIDRPVSVADWQTLLRNSEADYILLTGGSVVLRSHTLYTFATAVTENIDLIYADEDSLGENGLRRAPIFKPRFSPELLRRTSYLGRCVLLRNDNGRSAEAMFELSNNTADISDCISCFAQQLDRINVKHLPLVLYHDPLPARPTAACEPEPMLPDTLPTVTIVVPTKDRVTLLMQCLRSISDLTQWPPGLLDIVVVDNGSVMIETKRFLRKEQECGHIRVIDDPGPFNYSRINNLAAATSKADVIVFLNNDTHINRADWLRLLVAIALKQDVGIVGPKLLYPDGKVQHGGVIIGLGGVAGHAHVGRSATDGGYCELANITHEVSAVTGACLAVRRSVFEELGGFDEVAEVSFNDTLLCLKALSHGYRNIYVAAPLVTHHESKTRGFDDTPLKIAKFRAEALYARTQYSIEFKDDPYYNPNLSLERPYSLAEPPRTRRPWHAFARNVGCPIRVLILSIKHQTGRGVAGVVRLQAEYLVQQGFEVFVGGPAEREEFNYNGCYRIYIDNPIEAAGFAFKHRIDCVIAHTEPFFSVVRLLGSWPRSIIYDHGEPNPDWFSDAAARRTIDAEKRFCCAMADRVYCNSRSTQAELDYVGAEVMPLGNSHLASWDSGSARRRKLARDSLELEGKVFILNVCRFHQQERLYKGIDVYVAVLVELQKAYPELSGHFVFGLCGRSHPADVVQMEALGLRVFANVSDEELIDLYVSADLYMNFSRWEGYNLGVGQALAMGLPVFASDIPAHREFDIPTSNDLQEIVRWLVANLDRILSGAVEERRARIWPWEKPLVQLANAISGLCAGQDSDTDAPGRVIRADGIPADGSYPGCLTANRWLGKG
jgi:GT2 family glycosyltransferase